MQQAIKKYILKLQGAQQRNRSSSVVPACSESIIAFGEDSDEILIVSIISFALNVKASKFYSSKESFPSAKVLIKTPTK